MNSPSGKFNRTDFGHVVYDRWYLEHARHNFEARDFIEKHIPFYEKALQLSKDDKILEAGCGIGSYSREFVRRGYHVIGMDLSPNFLSEAKKITQHENLEIEFILGEYNEMSFQERFSVIFFRIYAVLKIIDRFESCCLGIVEKLSALDISGEES